MKVENWLPVVGYEGLYEVSDWGRVKAVGTGHGRKRGRLMNIYACRGFQQVRMSIYGKQLTLYVHDAVATAFIGKAGNRAVNHRDGNCLNNRLNNLEWVKPNEDHLGENWVSIVGYEGIYDVSDHGRVRILIARGRRIRAGEILKQGIYGQGYKKVELSRARRHSSASVHKVVAEAFSVSGSGDLVRHKDGNKVNNYAENLEWTYWGEHGRTGHAAKITKKEVLEIRRDYIRGSRACGLAALGVKYGISESTVSLIVNHKRWKHIV